MKALNTKSVLSQIETLKDRIESAKKRSQLSYYSELCGLVNAIRGIREYNHGCVSNEDFEKMLEHLREAENSVAENRFYGVGIE